MCFERAIGSRHSRPSENEPVTSPRERTDAALHYKMLRNLFGKFRYQFSRNALPVERKPERNADFIRLTAVASYSRALVSSFTKSPSNHGSKRSLQKAAAWAQPIEHNAPILPLVSAATQNIFAGLISSTLTVAFCLSYAALIFSGPLLTYGITVSFLSAAIGGLFVTLRSSLPFTLAGRDSATSAVTATLAAAAAERLQSQGVSNHLLEPVLIVLAISAALAGLLLCGLGFTKAGRIIRFVPYPVIGGFLAASGWLIVSGAFQVIAGHSLNATNLDTIMSTQSLAKLMAGGAVAFALFVGRYRIRNILALPGVLLLSIATVHLVLLQGGISLTEAQSNGWMFEPQTSRALAPLWTLDEIRIFPWSVLPALSGDLLAVVFVTTISLLLNITGIELAAQREADLDRELNALGIANTASAALGGYVSCVSLSRSILNHAAGASGRLPGIIVAGVSVAIMATSPGLLAYIPKCALGCLLLYIGVELLY